MLDEVFSEHRAVRERQTENRPPGLVRTCCRVLGLHLCGSHACRIGLVGGLRRLELGRREVLFVLVQHLCALERCLRSDKLGFSNSELGLGIGDRVTEIRERLQVEDTAVGLHLLLVWRGIWVLQLNVGLLLQIRTQSDDGCSGVVVRNLNSGLHRLLALSFRRRFAAALHEAPDEEPAQTDGDKRGDDHPDQRSRSERLLSIHREGSEWERPDSCSGTTGQWPGSNSGC